VGGGTVVIVPEGEHFPEHWTSFGDITGLSCTSSPHYGRFLMEDWEVTTRKVVTVPGFPSIQEEADRRAAERLATEAPGAAGW
jgi:hypothetical protein